MTRPVEYRFGRKTGSRSSQYSTGRAAKTENAQKLTAESRRFTQIRIWRFHRRDVLRQTQDGERGRTTEYAEEVLFAQSGDDDWAKTYSSKFSNVFVCRRLPTNKKLILCALCASAVIFLKRFLSVSISGVNSLRAWRLGAKRFVGVVLLNILLVSI